MNQTYRLKILLTYFVKQCTKKNIASLKCQKLNLARQKGKTYLLLLISVKRPQSFAHVLARAHVIALQKITVPAGQSKIVNFEKKIVSTYIFLIDK